MKKVTAVMLALLFTASGEATAQQVCTIGATMPLTGPAAFLGDIWKNGLNLATEEVNQTNAAGNWRLQIIYEDDQADPAKAVTNARKLISIDKVPLILSNFTRNLFALIPVIDENKVVLFNPSSFTPGFTKKSEWAFRISEDPVSGTRLLSTYAVNNLKLKRYVIYHMNDDYGLASRDIAAAKLKELGGDVLETASYDAGSTDFRSQLVKFKALSPQGLMIFGPGREQGLIIKQAYEMGFRPQFMTDMTIEVMGAAKTAGKEAVEGLTYWNGAFDPDSKEPHIAAFVKKYQEKFGKRPDSWAAIHYDAAKIVASTIAKAGCNADGIRQALYQVKDFPGVSGSTSILSTREVNKKLVLKKVVNGEFLFISPSN